eukprot:236070-Chlamydomonas_euryale.AAC.1
MPRTCTAQHARPARHRRMLWHLCLRAATAGRKLRAMALPHAQVMPHLGMLAWNGGGERRVAPQVPSSRQWIVDGGH